MTDTHDAEACQSAGATQDVQASRLDEIERQLKLLQQRSEEIGQLLERIKRILGSRMRYDSDETMPR